MSKLADGKHKVYKGQFEHLRAETTENLRIIGTLSMGVTRKKISREMKKKIIVVFIYFKSWINLEFCVKIKYSIYLKLMRYFL